MFGDKVSRSEKTRTLHRMCCALCVVTANSFMCSSLELGVKEQYLRVYNVVLDRLPWLKMSLDDFIKDGSILDFAVSVYLCRLLYFL